VDVIGVTSYTLTLLEVYLLNSVRWLRAFLEPLTQANNSIWLQCRRWQCMKGYVLNLAAKSVATPLGRCYDKKRAIHAPWLHWLSHNHITGEIDNANDCTLRHSVFDSRIVVVSSFPWATTIPAWIAFFRCAKQQTATCNERYSSVRNRAVWYIHS